MAFKDLRAFIEFLENRGDLRRIQTPVSRHLEITEIADRTVKGGGPALMFENVEGYETPLANFYLCGGGTHPAGEVTGAPGHNAAHHILRETA